MDESNEQSAIQRGAQKALDKLWESIPWAVGALFGAAISGWVALRDHDHAISDLQSSYQVCATREDCERRTAEISGVRVTVGELVGRVTDLERYWERHEASAEFYRQRIDEAQQRLRDLEMKK